MSPSKPARDLTRNAAILMAIGLATGVFVSAAMTGKVNADPRAALASHLNALLGCFWMISVAYSMPMLRYGEVGMNRLVWIATLPNFANWLVTAIKSFLRVPGVDWVGEERTTSSSGCSPRWW